MSRATTLCVATCFLLLLAGLITSLILMVTLWYLPTDADVHHQGSGICQVVSCNLSKTMCNGFVCDVVNYTYVLLNGTSNISTPYSHFQVSRAMAPDTGNCPDINSTFACYYDDRDISASLGHDMLNEDTFGASVFIGFTSFIIVVYLVFCCCVLHDVRSDYQPSRKVVTHPVTTDSGQPSPVIPNPPPSVSQPSVPPFTPFITQTQTQTQPQPTASPQPFSSNVV
jgi:hypothetical protein